MFNDLGVRPHNLAISSPLIVGDLVFVVTGNGVDGGHIDIPSPEAPSFIAVDKRTGKVAWTNNDPTALAAAINLKGPARLNAIQNLQARGATVLHGQWASPVFARAAGQDMVIFPGGDGWLWAYEPKTGKLLWKFDCNPKTAGVMLQGKGQRSEVIATPVVEGQRLYAAIGQDPEHERGVGHLWCIDLKRAVEKGRANADVSPRMDNFDPAAEVNRDSALAWHFGGFVPKEKLKEVGRRYFFGRTLSSCAVHDGLVYAAELGGRVYCLDALSGQLHWQHDLESYNWSTPSWIDGKIYIGDDSGQVWIFAHGKEKKLLNEIEMNGRVRTTIVAAEGTLFVPTENRLWAIREKK